MFRSNGTSIWKGSAPKDLKPVFCSLQLELYFARVFKTSKSCPIFLGGFMLLFTHYSFFLKT